VRRLGDGQQGEPEMCTKVVSHERKTVRLFAAAMWLTLAVVGTPVAWGQSEPPAAPTQCRTSIVHGPYGSVFIFVSWNDNSNNEDGFIVESWSHRTPGGWVLISTLPVGPDTTVVGQSNGLVVPNPQPRFRVRAFNAFGVSNWSNWATVKY
jgi:hypothetical protein